MGFVVTGDDGTRHEFDVGYDIFIERSPGEPGITEAAWNNVVENDPELAPEENEWREYRTEEGTRLAHATRWSGDPESPNAFFWFSGGRIRMNAPNRPQLLKAERLAEALGARVVGEEGEAYFDGAPLVLPQASVWSEPTEAPAVETRRLAQDLLGMDPDRQEHALNRIDDLPSAQIPAFLDYVFAAIAAEEPTLFVEDRPEIRDALLRLPEPATALLHKVAERKLEPDRGEHYLATEALRWRQERRK
jgi:hypothetical protein